jgi:hypothetical protein
MSDQQQPRRPGTIVNGHVLTEDGQWVLLGARQAAPPEMPKRSDAARQ